MIPRGAFKAAATAALLAGVFLSAFPPLRASAPAVFNYQGKLADRDGVPVNAPTSMSFRIFDQGGALLTTYTPAAPVAVVNGAFNVGVGDLTAGTLSGSSLELALSGPGDRFLEVVVAGTPLSPRRRLAAAPYALSLSAGGVGTAQLATGAVTDAKVSDVSWGKVTGVPGGFADGVDDGSMRIESNGAFVVLSSSVNYSGALSASSAAGWARTGVSASSVTLMGNAFNAPNRLFQLGGGGVVPVALGGTGASSTDTARAALEGAWSGTAVTAGSGLNGGGPLSADVPLTLDGAGFTPCDSSPATGKVYWDGALLRCGSDNAGGGGTVGGSGTTGRLPRWQPGGTALADGRLSESGSLVTVSAGMTVSGNVSAGSLSGSGSGLTGVDADALGGLLPAALSPAAHAHDASAVASGVLATARGGTGIGSYTPGNYLRAQTATTLQQRTPSQVRTDVGAAQAGANGDITALNGLTTPLTAAQGGTGANNAASARANLGAAKSGVNTDITSLGGLTSALSLTQGGTGGVSSATARTALGLGTLSSLNAVDGSVWTGAPLSIANGGTGASSAASARANLGLAAGGVNGDITELAGLTMALTVPQGGTGLTAYPAGYYLRALNATVLQARAPALVLSDIGAAQRGANADITGLGGLTTPLDLAQGGTGGISSASARTGLGLGAVSTMSTVTDGAWSGTPLSVSNGGTGGASASSARTNLGLGIGSVCGAATEKLLWDGTQLTCGTDAASGGNTVVPWSWTTGRLVKWRGPGGSTNTIHSALFSDNGSTVTLLGNWLDVNGTISGTWAGNPIPLAYGGTSSTDTYWARWYLQLYDGTIATTNTIGRNHWDGAGPALSVGNGGTGALWSTGTYTEWQTLMMANLGLGIISTHTYAEDSLWTGTLSIANGGTGATTASGARSNLGIGTFLSSVTAGTGMYVDDYSWGDVYAGIDGNPGSSSITYTAQQTFNNGFDGISWLEDYGFGTQLGIRGGSYMPVWINGCGYNSSLSVCGNNDNASGDMIAANVEVTGGSSARAIGVRGITSGHSSVIGGYFTAGYSTAPLTVGLYAQASGTGSRAAIFQGNVYMADRLLNASDGVKTFVIPHPVDPARRLVHGALEGPEGAVYYRGTAWLEKGRAEVSLPPYFEVLTHMEGRTVMLTPLGEAGTLAVKRRAGAVISEGKFLVVSKDPASNASFVWEAKAVRKDIPPVEVEPLKSSVEVGGDGPYTYIKRHKGDKP